MLGLERVVAGCPLRARVRPGVGRANAAYASASACRASRPERPIPTRPEPLASRPGRGPRGRVADRRARRRARTATGSRTPSRARERGERHRVRARLVGESAAASSITCARSSPTPAAISGSPNQSRRGGPERRTAARVGIESPRSRVVASCTICGYGTSNVCGWSDPHTHGRRRTRRRASRRARRLRRASAASSEIVVTFRWTAGAPREPKSGAAAGVRRAAVEIGEGAVVERDDTSGRPATSSASAVRWSRNSARRPRFAGTRRRLPRSPRLARR